MNNTLFEQDVRETISVYENAVSHFASRTRQLIERCGYVGALSSLMNTADIQKGFKVLRDANNLEKTFEAVILKYKELFEKDIVDVAQWRLNNPYWEKQMK